MKISLRRFVSILIGLVLVCSSVTIVILGYSSTRNAQTAAALAEAVESEFAAQAVQQNLNTHHRQALLGGIRSREDRRAQVELSNRELLGNLVEISKLSSSANEEALVQKVKQTTLSYLADFERQRGHGVHSAQLYQAVSAGFYQTQEATQALINFNLNEARVLQEQVSSENRREYFFVSIATLFLITAVVIFLWGLRRLLYIPILSLKRNIEGYELGSVVKIETVSGADEIKSIAYSFGELVTKLNKQKELQLTFLAAIAHDLKNPLGAIKMSTEILGDEPSMTAQARDLLAIVNRQTDHMKRLIEDLLDTARIESGHMELRMANHDIRKILKDTSSLHANLSSRHSVQLQLPEYPLFVQCDEHRLTQVFNNLLNNAVKYSPDGGEILVSASIEKQDVVIKIKDSGVGILPEDLGGIFEPFRRSSATKKSIPGVGLGLAVSKKIVNSHQGGAIEVVSHPGQGSTFTVRLMAVRKSITFKQPDLSQ